MVLRCLAKGHSYEEAREELGVGITTMKEWKRLLSETGSLEKRSRQRRASKFPSDQLEAYVNENPDATLKNIADHFGGSTSGAHDALAREEIAFKKSSVRPPY